MVRAVEVRAVEVRAAVARVAGRAVAERMAGVTEVVACRLASSSRAEEGYMTPSGLSHRSRAKMTDWIIDSRWLEVGLGQG